MNNDNEILAQKRAWRTSERKGIDRRKKDGSREDRKSTADALRAGRHKYYCSCSICELETLDRRIESKALMVAIIVIVILCGLLMWGSKAHAEDINMDVIADIESGGDPLAKNGDHIGMYQISEGVVIDFNTYYSRENIVTINDMYNPYYAKMVATYYMDVRIPQYLKEYSIPDTITSRIIAWNWGIGHLKKWYRSGAHWNRLPRETRQYIRKYFQEVNQ